MAEHGDGRVYFANLNPGEVKTEFFLSVVQHLIYDLENNRRLNAICPRQSGACVSIHRNDAVAHFLDHSDCDWIWFVDSDIEYEPETLDILLAAASPDERPVVSGLYMMNLDDGLRANVADYIYRDGYLHMTPRDEINFDEEMIKCDGTGAGCLLIHRSLLEAMRKVYHVAEPWFAQQIFDDILHGEDYTFCLRVAQMGFPIYVNTTVNLAHIKKAALHKKMLGNIDVTPHGEVVPA